ncbi:hypothetical protein SSX86_022748 [Deinandra increscens subsp. villosa]|uniref:peptidylprolyl isomerase n=1 Tax=Deinandra increscens subsp. villosa TaxID=3103831 RepID=A0AAP0CRB8_9ASTR
MAYLSDSCMVIKFRKIAFMPSFILFVAAPFEDGCQVVVHVAAQVPQQQPRGPLVQWERFLQVRSIKVMLVENDDCTRHIVTALLCNCNYEDKAASTGCDKFKSSHYEVLARARFQFSLMVNVLPGLVQVISMGYLSKHGNVLQDLVPKSDGVEFTVQDDGFGEKGKQASGDEGGVPAIATLQITLELVSWKTVSDITKDRKVIKKILKEGEGYERPNEGAVVQEQVIDGLDRAVVTMKKGVVPPNSTVIYDIAPEYAFGSTESRQELAVVPPNSTVTYDIELVSFVKEKESWDMNTQEKIEAAGKKKEEGNSLFKAAKYIEYDSSFGDEEKKQAKTLKVSCNLNNAACKLKLKDYKQVEKLCTKVCVGYCVS